jgi:cell shape-determining protein MreC
MEQPTNVELSRQIDALAEAVAAGFAEMRQTMVTQGELNTVRQEMATQEEMNKRFDVVEQRLDRIEKSHGYRLETLERDVANLKT